MSQGCPTTTAPGRRGSPARPQWSALRRVAARRYRSFRPRLRAFPGARWLVPEKTRAQAEYRPRAPGMGAPLGCTTTTPSLEHVPGPLRPARVVDGARGPHHHRQHHHRPAAPSPNPAPGSLFRRPHNACPRRARWAPGVFSAIAPNTPVGPTRLSEETRRWHVPRWLHRPRPRSLVSPRALARKPGGACASRRSSRGFRSSRFSGTGACAGAGLSSSCGASAPGRCPCRCSSCGSCRGVGRCGFARVVCARARLILL